MKKGSSWEIAMYIAAGTALFCAAVAWFLPIHTGFKILLIATVAASALVTSKIIFERAVFTRIAQVTGEISQAVKNPGFRDRIESNSSNELEVLESAVRRLIREKTIEIDNLKELERMRKEFLGDVAHELRSPVFNIQGYIHTLIEGAMDDEQVSRKFLDKAARHVDHLTTLVEDLVTISRIEAGEVILELTHFDIKELIGEVIELQDLAARQKNIALEGKFDNSAVMVRADRQKIRQVLINLVSNSIKYGREGGHTSIKTMEAPGTVTVEVHDNGEGIPSEHLARIFERFYRVDKSRARTHQSTGLGLAIVKHFIEAHKQKIFVTSHEGVGSIFSFTLAPSAA
jgi:two-component system, OmpR family, phosphate regulon sensor histidine kinase PhoR